MALGEPETAGLSPPRGVACQEALWSRRSRRGRGRVGVPQVRGRPGGREGAGHRDSLDEELVAGESVGVPSDSEVSRSSCGAYCLSSGMNCV